MQHRLGYGVLPEDEVDREGLNQWLAQQRLPLPLMGPGSVQAYTFEELRAIADDPVFSDIEDEQAREDEAARQLEEIRKRHMELGIGEFAPRH